MPSGPGPCHNGARQTLLNRDTHTRVGAPSVTRRIAQSAGIVMATVLASRVLGLFREWAVARMVGAGAVTDAYYAAFTLPDFLNYLMAGGALSVTFIPVFAMYASQNREDEGWHVFSTVATVMSLMVAALILAAEVFAPQLVAAITPGFHTDEKARVVFLTRLMLPAQYFFYMGGILAAVQYAKGQFVLPSLAAVVYNLAIIMGGALLAPRLGITGFSVGVLVGAMAGNFLLQIYGATRAGARFTPNFDVHHAGFRLFVRLSIPMMLALSITFMDDLIIRWFGSYLVPASITWLSYGKILMRVPLGLVGQAVGVAAFPFLAQLYSEEKFQKLNQTLDATLKGVILALVPISALTIAQSRPLVYLVFTHTKLRGSDFDATASALAYFSLGMVAWAVVNILARGFYAARDTLTPAVSGTMLTFLNLPVYWLLVRRFQFRGLALASSIGVVIYTAILFVLLARRLKNRDARGMVIFSLKVTVASVLAALAAYGVVGWWQARFAWQSPARAFVLLVVASTVGLVLTTLFAKLMRVREIDEYLSRASLSKTTVD
ncbi:MAG: murein biosynthesis integral membrane protein MurJ [Acidobacteria bacterium]|nr:MAG: murein biosynthesis integral membrane protein MurJ [Acidobacteriota bacterium]